MIFPQFHSVLNSVLEQRWSELDTIFPCVKMTQKTVIYLKILVYPAAQGRTPILVGQLGWEPPEQLRNLCACAKSLAYISAVQEVTRQWSQVSQIREELCVGCICPSHWIDFVISVIYFVFRTVFQSWSSSVGDVNEVAGTNRTAFI